MTLQGSMKRSPSFKLRKIPARQIDRNCFLNPIQPATSHASTCSMLPEVPCSPYSPSQHPTQGRARAFIHHVAPHPTQSHSHKLFLVPFFLFFPLHTHTHTTQTETQHMERGFDFSFTWPWGSWTSSRWKGSLAPWGSWPPWSPCPSCRGSS